jgi:hypothetical protein
MGNLAQFGNDGINGNVNAVRTPSSVGWKSDSASEACSDCAGFVGFSGKRFG